MDRKEIVAEVLIETKPALVWRALTDQVLMTQWMNDDDDFQLELETDWKIGGKFITRGFHHVKFENSGTILELIPCKKLTYTQLSSLSELEDKLVNYCVFEFSLYEQDNSTLLQLSITNFPTETIFKHLELYWKVTLVVFRKFVEENC